jgi:uncharacterized protein YjiS (DUF1127 family)
MNTQKYVETRRPGAISDPLRALTGYDHFEIRAAVAGHAVTAGAPQHYWINAGRRIGELFVSLPGLVVPWLKGWTARHRTEIELAALSDSMLRDIGIERSEIPMVARAAAATVRNRLRAEWRHGGIRPAATITRPTVARPAGNVNRPTVGSRHAGAA